MREDDAFVRAILADPRDDSTRLVYADWLEERGDSRGEYLRLEAKLASVPVDGSEAPAIRERMVDLRCGIDPAWLALFDQPGVMRANPTPFPAGWWSVGLEGYREEEGTYTLYPYESLPPLPVDRFHGDFGWLMRSNPVNLSGYERQLWLDMHAGFNAFLAEVDPSGLKLPRDFLRFMDDYDLQIRLRSCTDCWYNLPKRAADMAPLGGGARAIRFYSDSQSCMHWYLYVNGRGYHCILAGCTAEDSDEDETSLWYCAPTFEAFIYRFWIENEIWYALSHDRDPLTEEEQAYLDHYRRH
jgi:uncharacterized protein (TIGR02996 family)